MLEAHTIQLKIWEYIQLMQFMHASAHYTSENWELLRIPMITYDFKLAMTKEF